MTAFFWSIMAASLAAYVSPAFIAAWERRNHRKTYARVIAQAQNWRQWR